MSERYQCTECSSDFSSEAILERHVSEQHQELEDDEIDLEEEEDGELDMDDESP
jgi:uncharacterized Zn-finger protein